MYSQILELGAAAGVVSKGFHAQSSIPIFVAKIDQTGFIPSAAQSFKYGHPKLIVGIYPAEPYSLGT